MIAIDGIPVDPDRQTLVSAELLTLDMPPVDSLGPHTVELLDGFEGDQATLQVVAPSSPQLELGSGDPLNQVSVAD